MNTIQFRTALAVLIVASIPFAPELSIASPGTGTRPAKLVKLHRQSGEVANTAKAVRAPAARHPVSTARPVSKTNKPTHVQGGGISARAPAQHSTPAAWRKAHPDWDGHLFYRDGVYYFDPAMSIVADLSNEWVAIAAVSGGVPYLSALKDSPYLFFSGERGELLSVSEFNFELQSKDPVLHLQAQYFTRPFFWRDGIRYDRLRVDHNGGHFMQFVRHE